MKFVGLLMGLSEWLDMALVYLQGSWELALLYAQPQAQAVVAKQAVTGTHAIGLISMPTILENKGSKVSRIHLPLEA